MEQAVLIRVMNQFKRCIVEFKTGVICSKCQQPIVHGENFGYVCFKIPGKDGYHFFHRRFRGGDCWETYLQEIREKREGLG